CRRILRNHHDAEDAFQAVFLVLAQKAGAILPRDRVPNWLYGVACRTAWKARGIIAKRRRRRIPPPYVPERESRCAVWLSYLSPALVASTIKAVSLLAAGKAVTGAVSAHVAALAERVVKAMFLFKIKFVTTIVLAVALVGTGAGGFLREAPAADDIPGSNLITQ